MEQLELRKPEKNRRNGNLNNFRKGTTALLTQCFLHVM